MRAYKNPHGYVVDLPEFKVRQREPVPVSVLDRGACATTPGLDPDIFFPDDVGRGAGKEAKAICAGCPVRLSCLHYSVRAREEAGVWGGVTENERLRKFVPAYNKTGKLPWFCQVCGKPYVRIDAEPYCSAACYQRYEASTARLKRKLLALAGHP